MKELPTLPPVFDVDDASYPSQTDPSDLIFLATLPVDADFECAEFSRVSGLPRPGARVEYPFPDRFDDYSPFTPANDLPGSVDPLPLQPDSK